MDQAIITFMKFHGYDYDAKTKQFVKPDFSKAFEMFGDIFGKTNDN